jgi:hypothetical protein
LDSGWTGCYHFYAGGYGVRYRHEEEGVINIFNLEGRLQGLLAAAEVTAFRTALATMTLFVHSACRPLPRTSTLSLRRVVQRTKRVIVASAVRKGIKVVTASPTGIQGVINIFNLEGRLQGLLAAAEVQQQRKTRMPFCLSTAAENKHVVLA